MKKFSYKKNDVITLTIDRLNDTFEGIVNFSDKKLVIPSVLPAEEVEVRIVKVQKNTAFAILLRIIKPSKDRNSDTNKQDREINELNYINYQSQLIFKRQILRNLFAEHFPAAGIEYYGSPVEAYRNKINLPVQFDSENRKYLIGTYQKRSHRISDLNGKNPALTDEMNNILQKLKKVLDQNRFTAENHIPIRNIFIRGEANHGYQAGIVLADGYDDRIKILITEIMKQNPALKSFFYAVSGEKGNSLLIKEPSYLTEQEFVEMQLLDKTYRVSPESFFQINSKITEAILKYIGSFFSDKKISTVYDLFSGVGVLSNHFADKEIKRTCIELNETSFAYADKTEGNFICCDMTTGQLDLPADAQPDLFIFDPPRKGIGAGSIAIIKQHLPTYIAYLSCNPHSQQKDIEEILKHYQIEKMAGFDMFPFTNHIESLLLLKLK